MKRFMIICAALLSLSLLAGCMPATVVTSPKEEEFQKDWEESMDEFQEDLETDLEDFWDGFRRSGFQRDQGNSEKDHYWRIQDLSDPEGAITEAGTVTDEEQVRALDDLLSDDGSDLDHLAEDPGDPAYSYVYCQLETLKAGQDPEDREYEELVRFTVSGSEDVVTMRILETPSLLGTDLGDLLTFTYAVPADAAEALRNPGQFLE